MKIKQLSVFLENIPGQVGHPCKVLAEAGINIKTLSLADSEQFGILRLIVKDPDTAKDILQKAGCVVNTSDVLAIEVPDKPGGMAAILDALEQCDINIEYMYAFTLKRGENAIVIVRVKNVDAAIDCMQKNNISVLASDYL